MNEPIEVAESSWSLGERPQHELENPGTARLADAEALAVPPLLSRPAGQAGAGCRG